MAIDIKPEGDHLAVYDQLDEYETGELLSMFTPPKRSHFSLVFQGSACLADEEMKAV